MYVFFVAASKKPENCSERDEQIWDPQRAAAAEARGEDIEGFIGPAKEVDSQVMLMQALHQADYSVLDAELKFVELFRASKDATTELSEEEIKEADAMFETSRKEFGKIAAKLNRSVSAVMVRYYAWKSDEKKFGRGGYARLKNLWKNEADVCSICDDGGILIICEHCHQAFHYECLNPPLKEEPKTSWYCSQCMKSPAKLRRLPSSLSSQSELPRHAKPSAKKALLMGSPTARKEVAAEDDQDDTLIDLTDSDS